MVNYPGEDGTRGRLVKLACWRKWRFILSNLLASLLLYVGITVTSGTFQSAFAIPFSLDTSALMGKDARLEFSLLDGDLTPNNNATISGAAINGTLSDAGGFGQFLQDLTLGSALSFNLDFTTNFAGGDPDLLVLNLLDPFTNLTLVDTDLDALSAPVPYQDALLVIQLKDNGAILLPTATTPPVGIAIVPEPSTVILLALGLPLVFLGLSRSQNHH